MSAVANELLDKALPSVGTQEAVVSHGRDRAAFWQATSEKAMEDPKGEIRGRKFGLPDDVHDRLWQFAREKKITISAVAAGILDKNLAPVADRT